MLRRIIIQISILLYLSMIVSLRCGACNAVKIDVLTSEVNNQVACLKYKITNECKSSIVILLDYFALKIIDDVSMVLNEHSLSNINTIGVISASDYGRTINCPKPTNVGDGFSYSCGVPNHKNLKASESFELEIKIPWGKICTIDKPIFILKFKYGNSEKLNIANIQMQNKKEITDSNYTIEVSKSINEVGRSMRENCLSHSNETRFNLREYFTDYIFCVFIFKEYMEPGFSIIPKDQ